MEPRITRNGKYKCKKSVTISGQQVFIKGKTYIGYGDDYYPDQKNPSEGDKHCCGFIYNEQGQPHAWPYLPERHLWCSDRWTDFFFEIK